MLPEASTAKNFFALTNEMVESDVSSVDDARRICHDERDILYLECRLSEPKLSNEISQ